jgi:hypothetical protein
MIPCDATGPIEAHSPFVVPFDRRQFGPALAHVGSICLIRPFGEISSGATNSRARGQQ